MAASASTQLYSVFAVWKYCRALGEGASGPNTTSPPVNRMPSTASYNSRSRSVGVSNASGTVRAPIADSHRS